MICDLTFLFGLPQQLRSSHAVLLIQRISSQLSVSHAVSNRTNSCIVFCGIVVIGACKAGPHVFVTETAHVVLGFLPARPNAGPMSEQPWLETAIAADIANSSEVRKGTYAAFPRQRAQFDCRRFDGPSGAALSKRRTCLVHQI